MWAVCVCPDIRGVIHGCKHSLFSSPTSPHGERRPRAQPALVSPGRLECRGWTWTLCSTVSNSLCVSPCGSCIGPPTQCEPTNKPSLKGSTWQVNIELWHLATLLSSTGFAAEMYNPLLPVYQIRKSDFLYLLFPQNRHFEEAILSCMNFLWVFYILFSYCMKYLSSILFLLLPSCSAVCLQTIAKAGKFG